MFFVSSRSGCPWQLLQDCFPAQPDGLQLVSHRTQVGEMDGTWQTVAGREVSRLRSTARRVGGVCGGWWCVCVAGMGGRVCGGVETGREQQKVVGGRSGHSIENAPKKKTVKAASGRTWHQWVTGWCCPDLRLSM